MLFKIGYNTVNGAPWLDRSSFCLTSHHFFATLVLMDWKKYIFAYYLGLLELGFAFLILGGFIGHKLANLINNSKKGDKISGDRYIFPKFL